MEAAVVIERVNEFLERLSLPVSDDLAKDGWDEESVTGIRNALERFRDKVEQRGGLPPVEERLVGIARALDFYGVSEGSLLLDLAEFGNELRRA